MKLKKYLALILLLFSILVNFNKALAEVVDITDMLPNCIASSVYLSNNDTWGSKMGI